MYYPEQTTLAYIAGMIDGDGYISITKSERKGVVYFGPQIGIAGTRREPHDLASSIWGGKVSCHMPKNPKHRPQFQWSRIGKTAAGMIELILPYLRIKINHANLALSLFEHVVFSKSDDPFPWFGPNYDSIEAMNQMREEMININQSRNRLRKRKAGRLLEGREWNEFPDAH